MGISAVDPAAVAVDGRPRRLDVMPIVVRADQIDAARIVDGRSDRLEVAVKLAMVWIRRGYVVTESQRHRLLVDVVVVAMCGDGPISQRAVMVVLHRLYAGQRELRPPTDHLAHRAAPHRFLIATPYFVQPVG